VDAHEPANAMTGAAFRRLLARPHSCQTLMMANALLVFIGGGLGSVLRFLLVRVVPGPFPWGTLLVNALGGLAAGAAAAWLVGRTGPAGLFLITGLLGGFTTFSAFSLDVLALWQKGAQGAAAAYMLCSVLLAVFAAALGAAAVRAVG
jgi:fluoride exporter